MRRRTRTIERTGQFKRDYKREAKGRYRSELDAYLVPVLVVLANDEILDAHHRNHALSGDWNDHRDCHIKPDLVLIYRNASMQASSKLTADSGVKSAVRCQLPQRIPHQRIRRHALSAILRTKSEQYDVALS